MINQQNEFGAKILLFGEYGVIVDGSALAIPYNTYSGTLKVDSKTSSVYSNKEITSFLSYLRKQKRFDANEILNLEDLAFDLKQGLFFDSTIPDAYGLGSSGALVASIFCKYTRLKSWDNLNYLKEILANMESHFHSSSSGFDPLVSFINKPLLIKNNEIKTIPDFKPILDYTIFILDTGKSRRTEPLVNLFIEKMKTNHFSELFKSSFIKHSNHCIDAILSNDSDDLYKSFKEVSKFQINEMTPMIPALYQDIWKEGLESDEFYLKLCAAGGGGFLLGITNNYNKFITNFSNENIKSIF
jgi:mevalonate kinase